MRKEYLTTFLLGFVFLSIIVGCSMSASNPVSIPIASETQPKIDIPSTENSTEMPGHELLGVWDMTFDPEKMIATIEPNREVGWHFNVKSYIPNPGIAINSWDPLEKIIDINVTLKNPYPIIGYDVRLIIYTDAAGHMLLNADDWTGLFDIPGGMDINPFKAYAKTEPNRTFAGTTNHIENLQIYIGNSFIVNFAVDASYPSNCEEPYEIGGMTQEEPLYDRQNARAAVHLRAYRWDPAKWMRVFLRCDEVFDPGEPIELDTVDNEYYYGYIVNYSDAPEGEYQVIISAHTDNPVPLWDLDTIYVTKKPIHGWAMQWSYDDSLGGLETDNGNIFFALNPTHRIMSYRKDATQIWSRDIDDLSDKFDNLTDLDLHPDFDYIYSTGFSYFCNSSDYYEMNAIKCFKGGHGGCSYTYECFTEPVGANDIVTDSYGNLYLTGGGDQSNDAYMWKVNSSLNSQWLRRFENYDGDLAFTDLAISEFDLLWAVGQFWGTTVDFDPTSGQVILSPLGYQDAFLTEWTGGGNYSKIRRWGGYNDSTAIVSTSVIDIDDDGYIFIGGTFQGTVDFDPGLFTTDIRTATDEDIYISKFNSSFNHISVIQLTGASSKYIYDVAIDHYGNIYICGDFQGTVDFDPGSGVAQRTSVGLRDMFLAKYSNDLNFQWVRVWGTSGYEWARQVVYDRIYNFVYLGGTFTGTLDFDPGEEVFEMTASGYSVYIMKLLSNGMWEY